MASFHFMPHTNADDAPVLRALQLLRNQSTDQQTEREHHAHADQHRVLADECDRRLDEVLDRLDHVPGPFDLFLEDVAELGDVALQVVLGGIEILLDLLCMRSLGS